MSHSSHETSHGGASHGSVKSYPVGFILSIILTVIPFAMVMNGTASHSTIRRLLSVWRLSGDCSPVYFLHMNTSSEERWNTWHCCSPL